MDPDLLNSDPDPAFQVKPDSGPDPGFRWPKIEKKYSWKFY